MIRPVSKSAESLKSETLRYKGNATRRVAMGEQAKVAQSPPYTPAVLRDVRR
jgi:hypothetical protein